MESQENEDSRLSNDEVARIMLDVIYKHGEKMGPQLHKDCLKVIKEMEKRSEENGK